MPRGGRRQGTQGKAYSNRTDLGLDYGSQGNAATGGQVAPQEQQQYANFIRPDDIPNLSDPVITDAPITTGLPVGPGAGPEVMPMVPSVSQDPIRQLIQSMLLISDNPDLVRILNRLDYEGR
jgi:hypothetical protein